VPLQPNVRMGGDEGRPVVVADPESPAARALTSVAGEVARQVSVLAYQARGNFVPLGGLTIRKT
jgi:ATP-binding protein involved in chromosome partitioning